MSDRRPFVAAALLRAPAAARAQVCADVVVANGDFTDGLVPGSMPAASVDDWTLRSGSPQVVTDGCDAHDESVESAQQRRSRRGACGGARSVCSAALRIEGDRPPRGGLGSRFPARPLAQPHPRRVSCKGTVSRSPNPEAPMRSLTLVSCSLLASLFHAPVAGALQGCEPEWIPTFGPPAGFDSEVRCSAVFDDGAGPALYVGGTFTSVTGIAANGVVRWDGSDWSPLASGVEGGPVNALAVYDDGGGPALYAAGVFSSAGGAAAPRIARWDGASWSPISTQFGGTILALAVFDDGSGPALYAGGGFSSIDGVPVQNVARWDGASWSNLAGGGTNAPVWSLAVFDDGGGPALYAGGGFQAAGGAGVSNIARWDGAGWSDPGGGTDQLVQALQAFDDGSGPALYAGGSFTLAGGSPAPGVARWDGATWSGLVGGVDGAVQAFGIFDDGGGAALYAGGGFTTAGGVAASGVAKWDGTSWSALSTGVESGVRSLTVYDDGGGALLYAGGPFTRAGSLETPGLAAWDGTAWSAPGPVGLSLAPDGSVLALLPFDDGGGPALYAAGMFTRVGDLQADGIARWDGVGWSDLAGGLDAGGWIAALADFDDGGGPALYAGGFFAGIGGVPAASVARWDGVGWSALGPGLGGQVRALAGFDDGSGPALYAGGSFFMPGGGIVLVARWDGTSWTGLPGLGPVGGSRVESFAVYDDGGGPALYAGGGFANVNGAAPGGLARWNGSGWTHVPGWSPAVGLTVVRAMEVFDDGSGPALHVAGTFWLGGAPQARNVARWDGGAWSGLGAGFDAVVTALAVHDDGGGDALYASGGQPGTARWDGASWSALGEDVPAGASALASYAAPSGPGLYVALAGGTSPAPSGDRYLALWGCSPDIGSAFCSGTSAACPCANPGAGNQGCANSTGHGASLAGLVSASVLLDLLRIEAAQMPAGVPCLLLAADGQAGGGAGLPFGDGLRCVEGNERRLGVRVADGLGGASWGPGLIAEAGYVPGQTGTFQAIYRDPSASPCNATFNLSNGLAVDFH